MKTGEVRTTQQSLFEPQPYRIEKKIFIIFGVLALLICVLGIIYLLLNLSFIGILEQAPLSLMLLLVAGLLGVGDLLLWTLASATFTPSTSSSFIPPFQPGDPWRSNIVSTDPQYQLIEQGRGNARTISGHFPMDPNATLPILNNPSSWTASAPSTAEVDTTIPFSKTIPPQVENQLPTVFGQLYLEEKTTRIQKPSQLTHEKGPVGTTHTSLLTQNFRFFVVPREGDKLERSADKVAYNEGSGRYALADGVGTSFLPGRWAQIVTDLFVARENDFESKEDAIQWHRDCSEQWHMWVEQIWLPQAIAASGQQDWSRDIARGAATTFMGCSFSPTELASSGAATVHVIVVGDTEFFLLRPTGNETTPWVCSDYYKLSLEEFGHMTENLATPEKRVERDHKWMHSYNFHATKGDCIVLATDALAQWILQQIHDRENPWVKLLSISTYEEFKQFVRNARNTSELEVDDTTLMIIPLL